MGDTVVPNVDTQPLDTEFEGTAMPEAYKDSPVGKYKTIGEVFKGYGEAQKLIGAKGVIIPGEKATPEEWDKFHNTLGRPEKPDGYKLTPIENLHPELKITPEVENGFKAFMHKHGLTGKQAEGLYKEYFGMISQSLVKRDEKATADKHTAETALRAELGGEYDNGVNKAKRLVEKFGGNDAREAFGDLGNNPVVLRTLVNISKQFSEDGFIKGSDIKTSEIKDAQQKITEINLNKTHPFWVQGPGHDEAVKEMQRLMGIVFPEEAA